MNEECIIFSVIDILCFEEDGSTFKKKMKPPTYSAQAYTRNTIRHALSYKQRKVKTNQTIVFMRKFHYCFHLIKFTNSIG
jgi:hypothetical protein